MEEVELYPENVPIWEVWVACHSWGRDGMTGRLRLETLMQYALRKGFSTELVDRVLDLEAFVWPLIKPRDGSAKG